MEGFYTSSSGVAIFKKEIFDQVPKKDLDCELFYSELKRYTTSRIIFTI